MEEHLIKRGFYPWLYNNRFSIDTEKNILTLYTYNLSGQITGYHNYRPDRGKSGSFHPYEKRYFTKGKKDEPNIWGIETLTIPHYLKNNPNRFLFVNEGIFDACQFHRIGFPALAVLSNDPKKLRNFFFLLSQNWNLIFVCDGDDAGKRLDKYGRSFTMPGKTDMGDLAHMCNSELHKWVCERL